MTYHSERKRLPYSPAQMFDLVADIESYPKFLPWCSAAIIRSTNEHDDHRHLQAELVVSFKIFREKFKSSVRLYHSGDVITIRYLEGPMTHMDSKWEFSPCTEGCLVSFEIDYEFRTRAMRALATVIFGEAMQRVVRAFERRAAHLYGRTVQG